MGKMMKKYEKMRQKRIRFVFPKAVLKVVLTIFQSHLSGGSGSGPSRGSGIESRGWPTAWRLLLRG